MSTSNIQSTHPVASPVSTTTETSNDSHSDEVSVLTHVTPTPAQPLTSTLNKDLRYATTSYQLIKGLQTITDRVIGRENPVGKLIHSRLDQLKLYYNRQDGMLQRFLISSCLKSDLEGVQHALEEDASPNHLSLSGFNALHRAARKDSTEVVRILLAHRAQINKPALDGTTALMISAGHSHSLPVLRQIIAAGANTNRQDIHGQTALHHAVLRDDHWCEPLEMLLDHTNIHIDTRDNNGYTALYQAIKQKRSEQAIQLIERTKNLNQTFDNGDTLLMIAVKQDQPEIVRAILEKSPSNLDLSICNHQGQNALLIAIKEEKSQIAQLILNHQFKHLNQQFEDGHTLLSSATMQANSELVENLLLRGVGVNQRNHQGENALQQAIAANQPEIFNRILIAGGNFYNKNIDRQTALHYAAKQPDLHFTETLLTRYNSQSTFLKRLYPIDWYINSIDNNGKTALHLAFANNQRDTAELLIRYGADENIIDFNGNIPRECLPSSGSTTSSDMTLTTATQSSTYIELN